MQSILKLKFLFLSVKIYLVIQNQNTLTNHYLMIEAHES